MQTIERLESENKELEAMVDSMKERVIHVKSEAELKWKSYLQCHELNLAQHDDLEKRLPHFQGRQNQVIIYTFAIPEAFEKKLVYSLLDVVIICLTYLSYYIIQLWFFIVDGTFCEQLIF